MVSTPTCDILGHINRKIKYICRNVELRQDAQAYAVIASDIMITHLRSQEVQRDWLQQFASGIF